MNRLIEYMKETGLINRMKIQQYFQTATLDDLLSFHEYACAVVEEDWRIAPYSPYAFAPSMDVSGFGGCAEIGCKMERASRFIQFSALYSDSIYLIVNSLTNMCFPNSEEEIDYYRDQLEDDFCLIHQYWGLLDANIACTIPPSLQMCPDCFQKLVCSNNELSTIDPLVEAYAKKAQIIATSYHKDQNASSLILSNLPELFPNHDGYFCTTGDIASYCQNIDVFPHIIEDRKLVSEFIKDYLVDELLTAKYESFIGSTYQAKYITSKPSDKALLDMYRETTSGNTQPPVFDMPFLSNTSTKAILDLRAAEQAAFNEYRLSLDQATKCYLASHSKAEARDIYDDIVYPAFVKLDAMFDRAKRTHRRTRIGELILSFSTVTLGLLTDTIPKDPATIFTTFCGSDYLIKQIGNVVEKKLNTVNELEKQDFYFLWRLKQKT